MFTTGTTGATSGGVVTQIVARGSVDFHLTGAAEITYWRLKHSTHTNFAMEAIAQPFATTVQFGGSIASITLNRTGDLIHRQYIVITLPGLLPRVQEGHRTQFAYVLDSLAATGGGDYTPDAELAAGMTNPLGGYYCHWTNCVGFAVLKTVRLNIGGHIVDTIWADYLYMYEELNGKAGKRLCDMVGKHESREKLIAVGRSTQQLWVPLPFWYTQIAGNALSLVSLAFHGITLSVEFEQLRKLIIVSNPDIVVQACDDLTGRPLHEINDNDLKAFVSTEYVYLDVLERNSFAEGLFDQLITCVQEKFHPHNNGNTFSIQLQFSHPVIELMFAIRLKANELANKWFDYSRVGPSNGSGSYSGSGTQFPTALAWFPQSEGTFDLIVPPEANSMNGYDGHGTYPDLVADNNMYQLADVVTTDADPLWSFGLRVNSLARFAPAPAIYFRLVQPYQHHSSIPRNYIYNYSFALYPEEPHPSGALNFSRVDVVLAEVELHPSIVGCEVTFILFARNWNVFSYIDGIGGSKFQ